MINKKILTLVSLLVVSFLLMGAGCELFPPPVENHAPSIISIPVETATVAVEYTYDVEATDSDTEDVLTYALTTQPYGMEIVPETGVITWRPSFGQLGENDVTVIVSDGDASDTQSFTIVVSEPPAVNLPPTINSVPATTATVGEAYTYDVNATDPDGDTLTYSLVSGSEGMDFDTPTISWTPTVDQVGHNDVIVKASDGALSDTQNFTIVVSAVEPEPEIELIGIVVDPKVMTLFVGDSKVITSVTATYEIRGVPVLIALDECTYTSSPTGVVTVDAGLVTAVAKGTTTVTVSYEGETDTIEVTVVPNDDATLSDLTVAGVTIAGFDPGKLTYSVELPYGANKVPKIVATPTDPNAKVNIGMVPGFNPPVVVPIRVTAEDGKTKLTYKVTFTVAPPVPVTVTGVTLEPITLALTAGDDPVTLVATVLPGDATNKIVTWDSSAEAVATVTGGEVTPLTAGLTVITVTTVDGGFTDTCIVTVSAVEPEPEIVLTGIEVDPKVMTLFVGETDFFKVTANYSDETTKNVTYDCVYVSNDTNIAKVLLLGPNDLQKSVRAVGEGIAEITVTYEGKKDELLVTVKPVLLDHIVVEPETMTLFVGYSEAIESVTAHYNDEHEDEIGFDECTFTLGPATGSLPVVSVNSGGEISALNPGRVNVVVNYGGKIDTILVIVNPVLLTSILVEPDTMTLFVREEETFEVTAHYNDTTNKNVTNDSNCVYSSDDTSIADVMSNPFSITQGWVEAKGEGQTTIDISYTEGDITKTGTIVVTVNPVELTGIEVDPDEVTLHTKSLTGITQQLGVTAIYSDGFTSDITSDCDYVSNDPDIASVDDNGLILAESLGTTTIIVTYLTDWIDIVEVTVIEPIVIDGTLTPGEWDDYYLGTSVTSWAGGMSVDVYGFADDTYLYAAYEADMNEPGWGDAVEMGIGCNLNYKTPQSASWPDLGYTILGFGGDGIGQTDGSNWNFDSFGGWGIQSDEWIDEGIEYYIGHPMWNISPNPNVAEVKIPLSLLTYAGDDGQVALSGQYWQYDSATPFYVGLP